MRTWQRSFSKTQEEREALAVVEASRRLTNVMRVIDGAGFNGALHEASGSASLLGVAHALYNEALREIEFDCELEVSQPLPFGEDEPTPQPSRTKTTRMRPFRPPTDKDGDDEGGTS